MKSETRSAFLYEKIGQRPCCVAERGTRFVQKTRNGLAVPLRSNDSSKPILVLLPTHEKSHS